MCEHGCHKWAQDTSLQQGDCIIHHAIRQRNVILIDSIHPDKAQRRALNGDGSVRANVIDDGSYNMLRQCTCFVYEGLVKFEVRHRELSPLLAVLAVYLLGIVDSLPRS